MKFGDTEILKDKEYVKLLKVRCGNDNESYCVIGWLFHPYNPIDTPLSATCTHIDTTI